MKKKKIGLGLGLLLLLCVGLCAACADPDPLSGYRFIITYNTNGGLYNGTQGVSFMTGVNPDESGTAYVPDPGDPQKLGFTGITLGKTGHFLEGWYTDEACTDRWDFETDKVSASLTLYAHWLENFRYDVICIEEDGTETTLKTVEVSRGSTFPELSVTPEREGYTFLRGENASGTIKESGWFENKELTEPWEPGFTHRGTVQDGKLMGQVEKIYTKWLKGEYTLVWQASDLQAFTPDSHFYLMDDVDFTGGYWTGSAVEFSGSIIGNGKTIRGVNIFYGKNPYEFDFDPEYDLAADPDDKVGVTVSSYNTYNVGLFGALRKGAKLENVTFTETNLVISDGVTRSNRFAGLLTGLLADGVELTGVTVSGKVSIHEMPVENAPLTVGLLIGEGSVPATGLTQSVTYSAIGPFGESYTLTTAADGNTLIPTRKSA